MKKCFFLLPLLLTLVFTFFVSCQELRSQKTEQPMVVESSETDVYYTQHVNDSIPSQSIGTVSNGSIRNATLLPFSGEGYCYFDTSSYLQGRAFMHTGVADLLKSTFREFAERHPDRRCVLMECSHANGGRLYPHRTHQNGLSIDFMSFKLKNGLPFDSLDALGTAHYFLEFDNSGHWNKDPNVVLDFESIAEEIYLLHRTAHQSGFKISKIIFKLELKDELFNTFYGKLLVQEGIYFARHLDAATNALHDDHFHIDFEPMNP